jgi:hypothetical protein
MLFRMVLAPRSRMVPTPPDHRGFARPPGLLPTTGSNSGGRAEPRPPYLRAEPRPPYLRAEPRPPYLRAVPIDIGTRPPYFRAEPDPPYYRYKITTLSGRASSSIPPEIPVAKYFRPRRGRMCIEKTKKRKQPDPGGVACL